MRNRFPSFRSSNSRSFGSTAAATLGFGGSTQAEGPSVPSSSRDAGNTTAGAGPARTAPTGSTAFLDEMDEDEVVARIMQQVRMCESSARRSLRPRPREGFAYALDAASGSVRVVANNDTACQSSGGMPQESAQVTAHPSSSAVGGRGPSSSKLYSVDDARPIPSYEVEVNTDRVGSLVKAQPHTPKRIKRPPAGGEKIHSRETNGNDRWVEEEDDAFAYLMSGTPQRRRHLQQRDSKKPGSRKATLGRRHRPSGAGDGGAPAMYPAAPPRYVSRPKPKAPIGGRVRTGGDCDSEVGFVEHYGLVQYESAEEEEEKKNDPVVATAKVTPAAAQKVGSSLRQEPPSTPRRTVREIRGAVVDAASTKVPQPVRRAASDNASATETLSPSSDLNHSMLSASSCSVSSPMPSSPPANDGGGGSDSKAIIGDATEPEAAFPRILYEDETGGGNPATLSGSSIMCNTFSWLGGAAPLRKAPSIEVSASSDDQRVAVERVAAQPNASERTISSQEERKASGVVDAPAVSGDASPPSDPHLPPPTTATTTLYERLARPVLCPTAAPSRDSSASVATPSEESVGSASNRTAARGSEDEDEIDVDVMRPWLRLSLAAGRSSGTKATARTRSARSSSSSHASASQQTLRTIREAGSRHGSAAESDDDDGVSSMVTFDDDDDLLRKLKHPRYRLQEESVGSRRRRGRGPRQGGSHPPPPWARSARSWSTASASLSRRRSHDDGSSYAATAATDPEDGTASRSSSTWITRSPSRLGGGRGAVGCMALMEGVLTGLDRAERAILGNLTFEGDDLWEDLQEDDYDLYSADMTGTHDGEDYDDDDDAMSSLATRTTASASSRALTAGGRSGLTASEDGTSAASGPRGRRDRRRATDSGRPGAPPPRRSPRRGQGHHSRYSF